MADAARPQRFQAIVGDATREITVVALDDGRFQITIDGATRVVDSRPTGPCSFSLLIDHQSAEVSVLAKGHDYTVEVAGRSHRLTLLDERAQRRAKAHGPRGGGEREIRAIMPGKVIAVLVEVGAEVEVGQGVLVIEAMKMENEVKATRAGKVIEVKVQPGQAVEAGELLAIIE